MHKVRRKDLAQAGQTMGKAFFHDPIWKGFFPDDEKRKDYLPIMFEYMMKFSFNKGHLYSSSEKLEGVAVWFAGKNKRIVFSDILFSRYVLQSFRYFKKYMKDMKELETDMKIIETERLQFMKGKKHIYLMAIGVSPEHQGKGHGGKILKYIFNESEKLNMPIYLETETEENVELYKHYGFKVIGERDFSHRNFYIWQMFREPL